MRGSLQSDQRDDLQGLPVDTELMFAGTGMS